MSKHTPGPWQYWPSIGQVNRPGDPNQICNIPPNGDKKPADENDANARLIAAAPDLLEALAAIVRLSDGPPELEGGETPQEARVRAFTYAVRLSTEMTQIARTALAKVTPTA